MSSDFYLTLPSKASADLHPDNTLTHYITTLPQRISLSGQWECGLVEMQYPHSWYNVREDDTSLFVIDSDGSTYVEQIDAGYYPGADALIRAINRVILSMVGDTAVPLLRAVPLEGKHGDVVSTSFDNVQYIPVLHKEFTTIEINIRDDAGRRVPFERGRVTVTLHFRRRKPLFFET